MIFNKIIFSLAAFTLIGSPTSNYCMLKHIHTSFDFIGQQIKNNQLSKFLNKEKKHKRTFFKKFGTNANTKLSKIIKFGLVSAVLVTTTYTTRKYTCSEKTPHDVSTNLEMINQEIADKLNKQGEDIFKHLADRMYCIAELNGNEKGEIEIELDLAAKNLEDILLQFKNISQIDKGLFFEAAYFGNQKIIKLFLDKGFDINEKNKAGQTLLMMAAFRGNVDAVKYLCELKANTHEKDKYGKTAQDYTSFVLETLTNDPLTMPSALPIIISSSERYRDISESPFEACRKILEDFSKKN